jgi:hypothetical protein
MISPQTSPHPQGQRRRLRTALLAGIALAFVAIGAVTVYFYSFTGFFEFDDEGYLMIGVRSFLQGHTLYDHVYAQYGPFYFLLQAALYSALHLAVSHDAVRAIMGTLWLGEAGLCGWSAYRLTRSWVFAALGFTAAIKLLDFFRGSPGHPEELCLALLLGVLLCACFAGESARGGWVPILLGCLIAGLALTKINIGGYAAVAIILAFLKAARSSRATKALFGVLAGASLSFPFAVLAPLSSFPWAQRFLFWAALSMGAALVTAWSAETEQFVTRGFWIKGVAASAGLGLLTTGLVLARGTTLPAMLDLTVFQYRDFARNWYIPIQITSEWIPAASAFVAVFWLWAAAKPGVRSASIPALNFVKAGLGVLWCLELRLDHWVVTYSLAIPFAWLLLVPATDDSPVKVPFQRMALCLLTIFAALYLLPVAGAQVEFAQVLAIPMVCVFLNDARLMLLSMLPLERTMRIAEIAAVLLALATNAFWAQGAVHRYHKLKMLPLAGAERIHTPAALESQYSWITTTLKNSCDSNFSMPGIFSLYFWTQTNPPTGLLMDNWIGLLNRPQQQRVVSDLSRYPKLCIVYNQKLVDGWRRGQDLTASPLARYIHDEFAPFDQRGDYIILARRGRIQPRQQFEAGVVALPR